MRNSIKTETFGDKITRLFGAPKDLKHGVKDITFQVTDDCCLRCRYCYQHNKGNHIMSFEVAKKVIDEILSNDENIKDYIDSQNSVGVTLNFIGGEPLLAIDVIDKITDYFISELIRLKHPWATRYRISICSNGVLYFDKRFQNYIKKNRDNLSFSISIDGNKELHDSCRVFPDGSGSYDMAMKAVKHYRDYWGGKMGSKMTIAPENVGYIYEAVKSLVDNGYDDINLNCVYEEGWTKEHATTLYYQLKQLSDWLIDNDLFDKVRLSILERSLGNKSQSDRNWCGGNGLMLAVDYRGNYYPCLRYMEDSVANKQEPYVVGNINEGIGQNPITKQRLEILDSIDLYSQSTQECIDCPISEGCGWCTAYNYECFGTPNKRATFICEMHKAEVLSSLYAYNKYYNKIKSNIRHEVLIPESWALNIISQEEFENIKEISKYDIRT